MFQVVLKKNSILKAKVPTVYILQTSTNCKNPTKGHKKKKIKKKKNMLQ